MRTVDVRTGVYHLRTGVDFASETENSAADAGADHGAVLLFVVDDLVFAAFNVISGGFAPGPRESGERFELIA